jgi:Spy/CpxP family protein refolding chaperone
MNPSDEKWQRLTVAARRSTDDRDAAAPYGFATRVVAQAWTTERPAASLVECFAWRALGVACLFAVLAWGSTTRRGRTTRGRWRTAFSRLMIPRRCCSTFPDMNKPWKVILAFLGVFLAGAVFGGFISMRAAKRFMGNATPREPGAPGGQFSPQILKRLTERLGLTPEQQEKIRPILKQTEEEMRRLRQAGFRETIAVAEHMNEQMAALLTPEQKTKLDAMHQEMRERWSRTAPDGGASAQGVRRANVRRVGMDSARKTGLRCRRSRGTTDRPHGIRLGVE